jgi:hypothetical protein
MRKPNKRETILGVVLVVAVFYTIGLDRQVAGKRRANDKYRMEKRQSADQWRSPHKTPAEQPGSRSSGPDRTAMTAEFDQWNTDPFSRPFALEEVLVRKNDGESRKEEELVLKGVMFTERGGAVMIGDKVLMEGDRIDRYVVVTITRHSVVLKDTVDGSRLRLEVD